MDCKRPLLLVAACLALVAAACQPPPPPPASVLPLGCAPLEGVEALLAQARARVVLIGGQGAPAREVWARVVCHAAAGGGPIAAAYAPNALAPDQAPPLPEAPGWEAAGAQIALAPLALPSEPNAAPAARTAESRAAADQLLALAASGAWVIALAPEDAASRRAVGLAGELWTPLGAALPADQALSVRVDALAGDAPVRVRLGPVEDLPLVGAARAYDAVADAPSRQ